MEPVGYSGLDNRKGGAGPLPRDFVTQTEDVLVDTRGYIYVTDKQWGLWILRYTGPNQPAPTDR
jgi:hypothetical protein